ncbi:ion channel [Nocardioides sp. SYSU DS0663]|uniref:ion channel n=1 Tax=Nocardioides sp. SYSU DS0663 TaxID=3416445 RepID=UPI003F4C7E78
MLDVVLLVAGALLLVAVLGDALVTTLATSAGAGPLTSLVLGGLWRGMLKLHRQDQGSSFLTAAGPIVLICTVLTWVGILWAGWTLVFLGSDAIVDASSKRPADVADVVYYAGFTVFTLGTGDFVATTPVWRIATAVASFCGLFLVTLAITYLLSVLSAVVARRALAVQIHGLGSSPAGIVAQGWTGEGFGSMFQQQLVSLGASVAVSAEQHLAYPVLHYFHSSSRQLAAPVAIAHLDDALTILHEAIAPAQRPERSAVVPLRSSVARYLSTASDTAWVPDADPPPAPDVGELTAAGVPILDGARTGEVFRRHDERRASLHRLVLSDGWSWTGPPPGDR